jgi:hypothetical protein
MNDEESRGRRFAVLRELELPPSTIDIQRAVTVGRSRIRRRRLAVGAAGFTTLVSAVAAAVIAPMAMSPTEPPIALSPQPSASAAPSPVPTWAKGGTARNEAPPAPTRCTGARLPMPSGGVSGIVTDADPTGRYITGYVYGRPQIRAVLWIDGKTTVIDAPIEQGGGPVVNAAGVVAGSAGDVAAGGRIEQIAWTYRNGKVTRIKNGTRADGETSYHVLDINTGGDILAIEVPRYFDNGQQKAQLDPVVLTAGGQVRRLDATPDMGDLFAGGIDDDGTVAGGKLQSGESYVWRPDGTREPLAGDRSRTSVRGIRNGWILGGSGDTRAHLPGVYPVVRWDLRTRTLTGYPAITIGWTWGINDVGWVAGGNDTGPVAQFGDRALELPAVPGTQGRSGAHATTISDDGRVVGGQADHPDGVVPVRWLCR